MLATFPGLVVAPRWAEGWETMAGVMNSIWWLCRLTLFPFPVGFSTV